MGLCSVMSIDLRLCVRVFSFFLRRLAPPMFPIKYHVVVDSCTCNVTVLYINYRAGAPIIYCNVMAIEIPQTALELNGVLNSCQKRPLFHHDLLFSWFQLGFRCLSPFFSLLSFPRKGFCSIMMCWFLLVPARVLVLVSLSSLFFLFSGKGFCSIMMSWLFVVPALVPVLVSLLLFFPFSGNGVCSIMVLVPPGSGSGSGACLPSAFFLLFSGIISWLFLAPAGVPVLVSLLLFFLFSRMAFCSTMISWFLVVPALVPVRVSLLISSFFSQEMVFCFLVLARVQVLVSLLLSSFFSRERGSVPS